MISVFFTDVERIGVKRHLDTPAGGTKIHCAVNRLSDKIQDSCLSRDERKKE
jgi:hypothetical protein